MRVVTNIDFVIFFKPIDNNFYFYYYISYKDTGIMGAMAPTTESNGAFRLFRL